MRRMIILIFFTFLATLSLAQANLRGSRASMAKQNSVADKEGLSRITEAQLEEFKKSGLLVSIPHHKIAKLDGRLPKKYRYCRPWTSRFITDLGTDYRKKFRKIPQINSGVRTVEYQEELRKHNGNAAKATGDNPSSHLTGSTVDITKIGMTPIQIHWMRNRLSALEKENLIDATEEFRQSVFHVMVFKTYPGWTREVVASSAR